MRRPDNKVHFWATPLSTFTEDGRLGRTMFHRYQDCAKSNIQYSVVESLRTKVLTYTDDALNKTIRVSTNNKNDYKEITVTHLEALGTVHTYYDEQGYLKSFTHIFDIEEEKLKLDVDFIDGNQWYLYQYVDNFDLEKAEMIDRYDNISNRSEFAHLQQLTSLVSRHNLRQIGSISLANRTDFTYTQVNRENKPSLGIYIPTQIPVKGKAIDNLDFLAHFPVQQFKMISINSDDSNSLSTSVH
jgi:hypothetical protein